MNLSGPGSIDLLARALSAEFPELDRERVRAAVQRAVATAAASSLDTEGYQVVNLHLARLAVRVSGISEDDALAALERSCDLVTDPKERARQLTRAGELAKLTSWD